MVKPLISNFDDDPSSRTIGERPVQRGPYELSDREIREALNGPILPTGELAVLFFAGALLSLSFLWGPSTLVGATKGLVAATMATFAGAITQISTTMHRQLKAQASDYQPVKNSFSQAKAAETDSYHPSRHAQCPRVHPSNGEFFFWSPVRDTSGARCRLAKRSKVRAVKIDALGKDTQLAVSKDAQLFVSNVESHR